MFGLTTEQQTAIFNWVKGVVGTDPLYSGQTINKPPKPLAVIDVIMPPKNENLLHDKSRDDVNVTTTYHKVCTISVSIMSDTDSTVLGSDLEESVDKVEVKTALKAAGLFCRYCLSNASTRYKLTDRYEYRSIVDFKFGLTSSFDETRDIIETVELLYE